MGVEYKYEIVLMLIPQAFMENLHTSLYFLKFWEFTKGKTLLCAAVEAVNGVSSTGQTDETGRMFDGILNMPHDTINLLFKRPHSKLLALSSMCYLGLWHSFRSQLCKHLNVTNSFYCREEKAIELYKQMKMKCKSKKCLNKIYLH